jgi:DNA topoisomerase-1
MSRTLVIVESPNKAKKLAAYLGAGYVVKASFGHVADLPPKEYGADLETLEGRQLLRGKGAEIVKTLRAAVQGGGYDQVLLASDPDREGEAIAWHIVEATGARNNGRRIQRITFHEITPDAIRDAVAHPRDIDMDLVNAQQARRILDRLVGYKLSPLLWKKVQRGLSAGRVQSVAVRLVVEREREIEEFVPVEYWTIEADLCKQPGDGKLSARWKKDMPFHAVLHSVRGKKPELNTADEAAAVIQALDAAVYVVESVKRREARRNPAAPFITSTLQQEAARKLGFTARRTMLVAQQLYEGIELGKDGSVGLITYMRTDSTNVATSAQAEAREVIGSAASRRGSAPSVMAVPNPATLKNCRRFV